MAKSVLETLAESADPKVAARFHAQANEGLISPIVLAELLDVRPQMIYGYLRKNKFADENAVGVNNTQKKTILLTVAEIFAAGYIDRKETRAEEKEAKIKAELQGEVYKK